jgi:hypothetical protein
MLEFRAMHSGFTRGLYIKEPRPADRFVRFGSFEADLQEGKLTKTGGRIRLQEQPFRILALLLEHPGELVTREEIRQSLWSHNTFVEFDAALNTAIRKLREALNDSADNPRFLENFCSSTIFYASIQRMSAERPTWQPDKAVQRPPSFRRFSTTAASSGTAGQERWRAWAWLAPMP